MSSCPLERDLSYVDTHAAVNPFKDVALQAWNINGVDVTFSRVDVGLVHPASRFEDPVIETDWRPILPCSVASADTTVIVDGVRYTIRARPGFTHIQGGYLLLGERGQVNKLVTVCPLP